MTMTMRTAVGGMECEHTHYGGFWRRVGAFIIDGLILLLATETVSFFSLTTIQLPVVPSDAESALALFSTIHRYVMIKIAIALVLSIIYTASLEASSLQATVGKWVLSMRVVDLSGARLSFPRALARNAIKFTVEIGFLLMPFTERRQALHDLISGCLVVGPAASGLATPVAPARSTPVAITTAKSVADEQARYAGFWRRFGAFIIDALIVFIISEIISAFVLLSFMLPIAGSNVDSSRGATWLYGFALIKVGTGLAVALIYSAGLEASNMQATAGKMALSMRVTDLSSARLSFPRALARNAIKLIVSIGFLLVPFTTRRQALHDMISGCVVVRPAAPALTTPAAITTAKPAGKWRKVLAAILDFVTISIAGGFAVAYVTGRILPEGGFSLSGIPGLVFVAVIVAYFIIFTKFLGGTLWQRLLRARAGNMLFGTSILISLGWLLLSASVVMSLDKPPNYPRVIFLSLTPPVLVTLFGWMLRYLLIGRKQQRSESAV